MKLLHQASPVQGYRIAHLVMHEEYGVPYIAGTGEVPDGVDFAISWEGAWREGRCYMGGGGNLTFVTYGDAVRIPLDEGIDIRLPRYVLTAERLLDLARAYAYELGHTVIQECRFRSALTFITAGEVAQVVVSVGQEESPVVVIINLSSWGDIRVITEEEIRRCATSSFGPA